MAKLSVLLAGVAGVSAYVSAPIESYSQHLLGSGAATAPAAAAGFKCDLPPVLDPAGDGLPSADDLFSSEEALAKQVKRHQAIVRVPSICYDDLGSFDEDERWEPFYDLHDVLKETYPTIHERAQLEKINTFGLLFTIQGSDESLKPVLLMAHQDVVPVADESTWTHPPFDAVYDGEWLWGRGASDDKNSLTALMSAIETLLSDASWTPRRTILLAFGFDEECSGYRGAGEIAAHLTERYGKDSLAIILDEGDFGLQRIGDVIYALPAVTEKGHVDIWLELSVVGGHSSTPFPHTGIGIVAEIVSALEAHPYRAELLEGGPVHNLLLCQARYSPREHPDLNRLLRRNDLRGVADFLVGTGRTMQYMIQTSQAVDFIAGGQKINAMPEKITLGVNYRVAHHDSIPQVQHNVVRHIRGIVHKYRLKVKAFEGDDEYESYVAGADPPEALTAPARDVDYNGTLVLKSKEASRATPVSPTSGAIWDVFSGTIRHAYAFEKGTVVPAGKIMTGNTDTRHYLELSNHVYRFTPMRSDMSENAHTIDERVRMEGHMEGVKFYYDFVRNFDAAKV